MAFYIFNLVSRLKQVFHFFFLYHHFMNWLQKICRSEEDVYHYFSIGHGDFSEELGFAPKFIVWYYDSYSREIEHGPESQIDQPGGTHESIWGHELTNKSYKGRYEPETGRLTIVKPTGRELYPVPSVVYVALERAFGSIDPSKVQEF